jgi:hypothetical protein
MLRKKGNSDILSDNQFLLILQLLDEKMQDDEAVLHELIAKKNKKKRSFTYIDWKARSLR